MEKYIELLSKDIKPKDNIINFHVYALWKDEEIVYIGQSTRVEARIVQHVGTKDFDSYSYFKCKSKVEMDMLESNLIITLQPFYNKTITSGYESIKRFRDRIRSIDDSHKYNPKFYVNKLRENLILNGFEVLNFKGISVISVQDVPKALNVIVGDDIFEQ